MKIVDITIPGDERVSEREVGKIEKYKVLKDEIARMWNMKEVTVIPVVVGALGAISTGFEKYITAIGIKRSVEHAQKNTKNSFIGDSKDFESGTWMLKQSTILSIILQDPVRPLATTGSCLLSRNQLEQLKRV